MGLIGCATELLQCGSVKQVLWRQKTNNQTPARESIYDPACQVLQTGNESFVSLISLHFPVLCIVMVLNRRRCSILKQNFRTSDRPLWCLGTKHF